MVVASLKVSFIFTTHMALFRCIWAYFLYLRIFTHASSRLLDRGDVSGTWSPPSLFFAIKIALLTRFLFPPNIVKYRSFWLFGEIFSGAGRSVFWQTNWKSVWDLTKCVRPTLHHFIESNMLLCYAFCLRCHCRICLYVNRWEILLVIFQHNISADGYRSRCPSNFV